YIYATEEFAQRPTGKTQVLGHDLLPTIGRRLLGIPQGDRRLAQMRALPLARHQCWLTREESLGKVRERAHQLLQPGARRARDEVNLILIYESRFNSFDFTLVDKIDLVNHDPPWTGWRNPDQAASKLALARVHDPQHQIRAGSLLARAPHAFPLDRI